MNNFKQQHPIYSICSLGIGKNLSMGKFLPCGTRERFRIVKLRFDKTEMDIYKVSYL